MWRCKQVVGWSIGCVDILFLDSGDDSGVSIVRLNSLVEGVVIEEDQDFFGEFGANVTFFLVTDGGVVEGWDWLDWPLLVPSYGLQPGL